jgi:hypothetical protein
LVESVLEGEGEGPFGSGGEGGDEEGGALDVEDGVVAGVGGREYAAGFNGGEGEVRDDDGEAEGAGEFEFDGAGDAVVVEGGGDDGAKDAGGDVVGVALDAGGDLKDLGAVPVAFKQDGGDDDTGDEGGGAGAESFAERDLIEHAQLDGGEGKSFALGDGEGGLPDEVVGRGGDVGGVAAFDIDAEVFGGFEEAVEVKAEREAEGVEARTEVGAGGGDADAVFHSMFPTKAGSVCGATGSADRADW